MTLVLQLQTNIVAPKGSHVVTQYSGVTKKGHAPYNPMKKNQDALVMQHDPATDTLVLAVFDGHGEFGDKVSEYYEKKLIEAMFSHPSWPTDVKSVSREVILRLEQEITRNPRINTNFSGTTLTMVIVRGDHITGVNIGDSRAVIGKAGPDGKFYAEEFTHDHKPDSPGEKERILAAGGRVFAVEYDDGIDGPPRVWLAEMDVPGLAMSRSIGDDIAHTAGVISEPEFTECVLNKNTDKFVIIATDGLWEFIDNEQSVQMVANSENLKESVDKLVAEANDRWMQEEQVIDDTTVIVGHFFNFRE
mmetsp:Transcript_39261/g.91587  ORF Transcript_39261/g.91587 Transcript_39261/m.91587 type:complete len:304 (-) Transcript_39261:53-964(-)